MNLPIEKQTVLITGAGRGLGSEIAKSFHREGAKVVINYSCLLYTSDAADE